MIHLICLGNPSHGDDGFGPAVYDRLAGTKWPAGIRLLNARIEGGAVSLFKGCRRAIVIDALPPGSGGAGQVLRLPDYPADPQGDAAGGAGGILATVRRVVVPMPEIEVIGVVAVNCLPFRPGLSPLVMAAVDTVAALIRREFGQGISD